jgi:hypothetical protein
MLASIDLALGLRLGTRMKRRQLPRPSPALVIALLALFVSLGGTGYAALRVTGKNIANNSITGQDVKTRSLSGSDVKRNTLTGAQIRESSLAKVPNAERADNAASLGGSAAATYAKTSALTGGAWIAITPKNGWAAATLSTQSAPSYWKDAVGVVHLRGGLTRTTGTSTNAFELPSGVRPAASVFLAADSGSGTVVAARVFIGPDGQASIVGTGTPAFTSLDGLSFRAEN